MEMFLEFLHASKNEGKIVSIRTDELDWDEAHVGVVVDLNEKLIHLNTIDSSGNAEGEIKIDYKSIVSVDFNDRYLRRLQFLRESANADVKCLYTHTYSADSISENLLELSENKRICTVYFEDDFFVTGIIVKVDETHFKMNNIGVEGDDDGFSIYFIDVIESIRYNSEEEVKIEILYKNRSLFYQQ